jgi:hypothetical protein
VVIEVRDGKRPKLFKLLTADPLERKKLKMIAEIIGSQTRGCFAKDRNRRPEASKISEDLEMVIAPRQGYEARIAMTLLLLSCRSSEGKWSTIQRTSLLPAHERARHLKYPRPSHGLIPRSVPSEQLIPLIAAQAYPVSCHRLL